MSYPTQVSTNAHGRCLVSTRALAPGAVVQCFEGPLCDWNDVPASEVRHALWVENGRWMVPTTDARFINHACEPNCRIDADNRVVSVAAIRDGDEITIAYDIVHAGEDPGEWDARWTFKCACGSARCRRLINGYVTPDGKPFGRNRPRKSA